MKSRILYDFQCNSCKTIKEGFVYSDITEIACSCGGTMTRLISTPRIALDGTDPGFPDAYNKWALGHEKQAKKEWAKIKDES